MSDEPEFSDADLALIRAWLTHEDPPIAMLVPALRRAADFLAHAGADR